MLHCALDRKKERERQTERGRQTDIDREREGDREGEEGGGAKGEIERGETEREGA